MWDSIANTVWATVAGAGPEASSTTLATATDPQIAALFQKFAGPVPLPFNDNYWTELLSASFELAEFSAAQFDVVAGHYCHDLASNNLQTGNLRVLILQLQALLIDLPEAAHSPLHDMALNACFLCRMYIKYFIETSSEKALAAQLASTPPSSVPAAAGSAVHELVAALLGAVARLAINTSTYVLINEVMKTLIILFSTQLNQAPGEAAPCNPFIDAAMDLPAETVRQVLHKLFGFIVSAPQLSLSDDLHLEQGAPRSGTVLASLRSAAASALFQIPYRIYSYLFTGSGGGAAGTANHCNLQHESLLVLLGLTVYRPAGRANPFCVALEEVKLVEGPGEIGSHFELLYNSLCSPQMLSDPQLLLLYKLLWHSEAFAEYAVHVRTDIDSLVLPLTQLVHSCSNDRTEPEQVDMCAARLSLTLPCLLMLTGNGDFNTNAQNCLIEPAQLSWCAEWAVGDTQLSSVLLLVLLRAVTSSLHTHSSYGGSIMFTSLAAIANLAPHVKEMSQQAAHRLVQLLETLTKKVLRLCACAAASCSADESAAVNEEVVFFQDLTQMLLDIFSVLLFVRSPADNPHLVYTLLHRQTEALGKLGQAPFDAMPLIQQHQSAIAAVVGGLQDLIPPEDCVDIAGIHLLIETHSNKIARECAPLAALQPAPAADRDKYMYDEQGGPDEFFAPFLWQAIVETSGIKWSKGRIMLYST